MSKKKDIIIDFDHALYFTAESNQYKSDFDTDEEPDADDFGEVVEDKVVFNAMKEQLKAIIDDYVKTAEVLSITEGWTVGKVRVILSAHHNFRYDIFPAYKANRKDKPKNPMLEKLRKWAKRKYTYIDGFEADELCCYYVRNGGIGFSTDKDCTNTEGIWFNTHHAHRTWKTNTKKEAKNFMLLQCLMGDSVDGIQGIKGVGVKTAHKMLDEYGWNFKGVVKAYESKKLTRKDAVLTRNLVDMTIWSPKKGLRLYK